MRSFYALLALMLAMTGCLKDPVVEADSEAEFNRSYSEVLRALTPDDQERLDTSLKDIVLVQAGIYAPMIEAQTSHVPKTNSTEGMVEALSGAAMKSINTLVATKWAENRDKSVVQYARAVVDGRTAKEIFVIAEAERNRAIDQALTIYREQLEKAKEALSDIQSKDESAAAELAAEGAFLANVVISKARFYYSKSGYIAKPVIAFTVANNGTIPIKRIFMHGTVQTPGRAIPWVAEDFNYDFPGGLEAGETQQLSLAPNMFSAWGKVPGDAVKGSVLELKLIAFEDASGNKLGTSPETDDAADRKKALEDGLRTLETKIQQLETNKGR